MIRDSSRGFSLLEVLVALTVLVLVFGALFKIFGGGVRAATVSERYSHATLVAQSRLAELAAEHELIAGVHSGRDDRDYRWQSTVMPYLEAEGELFEGPTVIPWTVTVEVSWGEGEQQRTVALSTLLLTGAR